MSYEPQFTLEEMYKFGAKNFEFNFKKSLKTALKYLIRVYNKMEDNDYSLSNTDILSLISFINSSEGSYIDGNYSMSDSHNREDYTLNTIDIDNPVLLEELFVSRPNNIFSFNTHNIEVLLDHFMNKCIKLKESKIDLAASKDIHILDQYHNFYEYIVLYTMATDIALKSKHSLFIAKEFLHPEIFAYTKVDWTNEDVSSFLEDLVYNKFSECNTEIIRDILQNPYNAHKFSLRKMNKSDIKRTWAILSDIYVDSSIFDKDEIIEILLDDYIKVRLTSVMYNFNIDKFDFKDQKKIISHFINDYTTTEALNRLKHVEQQVYLINCVKETNSKDLILKLVCNFSERAYYRRDDFLNFETCKELMEAFVTILDESNPEYESFFRYIPFDRIKNLKFLIYFYEKYYCNASIKRDEVFNCAKRNMNRVRVTVKIAPLEEKTYAERDDNGYSASVIDVVINNTANDLKDLEKFQMYVDLMNVD